MTINPVTVLCICAALAVSRPPDLVRAGHVNWRAILYVAALSAALSIEVWSRGLP